MEWLVRRSRDTLLVPERVPPTRRWRDGLFMKPASWGKLGSCEAGRQNKQQVACTWEKSLRGLGSAIGDPRQC